MTVSILSAFNYNANTTCLEKLANNYFLKLINAFAPSAPYHYPPENIRKPEGFLMFSEGREGSIGNKWVNRGVRIGERNFILGTLHMCILGIYILYKVLLFYSFSAFIYLFFCGTIAKYSVGELFIIFHIHKFSKNMTRRKLIKLFDF